MQLARNRIAMARCRCLFPSMLTIHKVIFLFYRISIRNFLYLSSILQILSPISLFFMRWEKPMSSNDNIFSCLNTCFSCLFSLPLPLLVFFFFYMYPYVSDFANNEVILFRNFNFFIFWFMVKVDYVILKF